MDKENFNPCGARRLRVYHVARRLGIPERTVRHLATTRRLPGYKIGDKIWFFDLAAIEIHQCGRKGSL